MKVYVVKESDYDETVVRKIFLNEKDAKKYQNIFGGQYCSGNMYYDEYDINDYFDITDNDYITSFEFDSNCFVNNDKFDIEVTNSKFQRYEMKRYTGCLIRFHDISNLMTISICWKIENNHKLKQYYYKTFLSLSAKIYKALYKLYKDKNYNIEYIDSEIGGMLIEKLLSKELKSIKDVYKYLEEKLKS